MYYDTKSKVAAIICYLFSWIGIIVGFLLREKGDRLSRHHLNQALVLKIITTVCGIITRAHGILRIIGMIVGLCAILLTLLGIYRAFKGSDEPLPVVGGITLI